MLCGLWVLIHARVLGPDGSYKTSVRIRVVHHADLAVFVNERVDVPSSAPKGGKLRAHADVGSFIAGGGPCLGEDLDDRPAVLRGADDLGVLAGVVRGGLFVLRVQFEGGQSRPGQRRRPRYWKLLRTLCLSRKDPLAVVRSAGGRSPTEARCDDVVAAPGPEHGVEHPTRLAVIGGGPVLTGGHEDDYTGSVRLERVAVRPLGVQERVGVPAPLLDERKRTS